MTLNDIRPGECAEICSLSSQGAMLRRLLDLGFVESTIVKCLGRAPLGDPKAFLIRGSVIALRFEDCAGIAVRTEGSHERS